MNAQAFFVLICWLLSVQGFGQDDVCQKASQLINRLNEYHVQPLPLDDQWSQRVFDNFFATIDPSKIYFTSEDIQKLSSYAGSLDEAVKNKKNCSLVDTAGVLLKGKIEKYRSWVERSLAKPSNYSEKESFDALHIHAHTFVTTDQELETRWKHFLKYQILNRMNQESLADSSAKTLMDFEKVAREKIKSKELQSCENFLKSGLQEHVTHSFLQAIATAYDPHSAYYSFEENEEFKSRLSQTDLSFGFSLAEDEFGLIHINSIVPGGPAWNSNDIHEDDLLISMEVPGKPLMNTMDYSVDELEDLLEDYSIESATFILKKK